MRLLYIIYAFRQKPRDVYIFQLGTGVCYDARSKYQS